jgi:hypothetical protein
MEVYETKSEVVFKVRSAPHLAQDAAGFAITPTLIRFVTFSGTDKTKPRSYVEAKGPSVAFREHRTKKWNVTNCSGPDIKTAPAWIRELVGA